MGIYINMSKKKVEASYKTIYLKNDLIEKLEKIASDNNTSFNNVVISMIEYCTEEDPLENKKA